MPENSPERRDPAADDAAWRDLVRRLEDDGGSPPAGQRTGAAGAPRRDATPQPDDTPGPDDPDGFRGGAAGAPGPDPALSGPRDYELPDTSDEDEGFIPEEPPALGSGDPLTVLAWCGAAGTPLALLALAMFWRAAPSFVWLGLCAVFVLGAAYLVWRLPRERSEDGDNGARV